MAMGKLQKNVSYIQQQVIALLRSTSSTVKCIWLIVFVSYSFSFFEEAVDIISVTPGYFLPPSFRIWTAFTFCFLETHFWNVLVDIVMIGLCGKVIEPIWGPFEITSFFAIVNMGVALSSSAFFLFVYMFTSNPDLLFNVHIHGLSGYIAGVTVAVKQIMPDIPIVKTPMGRITNRNMPLLTIIISLVLWLVNLSRSSNPVMVTFGVFISWIYLRFYQKHSSGTIGDMSESFNFASFFPSVVQPSVAVLANTVFNMLIKLRVCRRRIIQNTDESELSSIAVGSGGFASHDMERRKQKALKALTEHLNKTDRPRVVGTVLPQKVKTQSPKKKVDIVQSPTSAFIATEKQPLLLNEEGEHPVTDI